MQQFSVRLDGRDHAGHEVVTAQVAPDFFLNAGPGAVSQFSQQVAVEVGVQSQPFGNRQHDLAVRDRGTNFFGHMQCGQQRAFLVAGGTRTALLAGIGDKYLMAAVGTANTSKTFFQITALEKGSHGAVDDRSPEAVLGLKPLIIDLPEGVKMLIDQSPQVGGMGIAWAVQWQRLAAMTSPIQAGGG